MMLKGGLGNWFLSIYLDFLNAVIVMTIDNDFLNADIAVHPRKINKFRFALQQQRCILFF